MIVKSSSTENKGGEHHENRLQELRIKHGETQQQLAAIMGIKTAGYCKKELGYNSVTLAEAYAVATHWGLSIEEVFFADSVSEKESISAC